LPIHIRIRATTKIVMQRISFVWQPSQPIASNHL